VSISFNQIPIDIRTPGHYIEFDSSRAMQGLPVERHRVLLIGQRGNATANTLFQITSAEQGEKLFGYWTVLSDIIRAFKAANQYTELWAIGVTGAEGATVATGTITLGGTATANGEMTFHIGGRPYRFAVKSGDTAATAAAALKSAINADARRLIEVVQAAEVLTLTARGNGEAGNSIRVMVGYYATEGTGIVAGLTVAYTNMTGGALNPSIQSALDAVGEKQFHTVVMPYIDTTNLTAIENWLSDRFGPMTQKEGHAFVGHTGSFSSASTLGNSRNSPHLTIMSGADSPTPPWVWAAQAAARDSFEPDPARPRQTLTLPGCLPPKDKAQLTREERNTLLYDGISTYLVNPGNVAAIERLITTYKTNEFGVIDTAYLDIETLRTISYLRYTVRNRIATKYPRHKLANDGTNYGPGQAIVTPSVIRAELCALFREWELAGLVEGFEQFKSDLIVERNASDPNRVDAVIPPDVVNQFRVFAAQVQFRL